MKGRCSMTDILYTYGKDVYVNLTNQCDCSCTFCIRSNGNGVGSSDNLWFQKDPTLLEVKEALDHFDFSPYTELIFCGYGEPTCALDTLLSAARYVKEKFGLKTRLNSNGLANLYHHRDIVPELAEVIDVISISLNAPTEESYQALCRPQFPNALNAVMQFASACQIAGIKTKLTVVDVISPEEINACQKLADSLHLPLRVRHYT